MSEIYSPPRVTRAISSMPSLRLVPGFAIDLTCIDPDDGQPWDFDLESKQVKAMELVRTQKPAMLIGFPMCTAWCTWQALNAVKRPREVVAQEMEKARRHLKFVISLYREQMDGGRLFLHEHPESSSSWQEEMVVELLSAVGVERVVADQCQYGAEVVVGQYLGCPIRKSIGFMSNAPEVLNSLRRRCSGKLGRCSRRLGGEHAMCSGRIVKDAQRYPLGLCKAILRGIHKELQARGIMTVGDVGMHALEDADQTHLARGPEQGYSGKYLDDISKQTLRDDSVEEARREELEYFVAKGFGKSATGRKRPLRRGNHLSACDGWTSTRATTSRPSIGRGS